MEGVGPAAFHPHEAWAALLLPSAALDDPAHDLAHLSRVHANAMRIQAAEGGDAELLGVAAMLHDLVNVEKDSPLRAQASRLSAAAAREAMSPHWDGARLDALAHAVEAHSFSAGIEPRTLEARILRDADRLDGTGALGVARAFVVGGRIGRALYEPGDPRALRRDLDDVAYTLDHFRTKLLRLEGTFLTPTGERLARERLARTRAFLDWFEAEIGLEPEAAPGLTPRV